MIPEPTPGSVALRGLCPCCGSATLFAGLVRFAPKCRACALDFGRFNVGDGAVPFLIFIVGGLVTGLAIWLELSAEPPFWVHVLIWFPLATLLVVGLLRISKALFLALEYRYRAEVLQVRREP